MVLGSCDGRLPCMDITTPSESDYTTSTNPERFDAVIEYARNLISDLESEFVVERSRGTWSEDFPRLAEWNEESAAPIRLTPSTGVSLVFGFTAAPGVVLRVGSNVERLFPDCLCDACDSRVGEECANLQMSVDAATSGGFTEGLSRRLHSWEFNAPCGRVQSSVSRLRRGEWKRIGERGKAHWAPWGHRDP